MLVEKLSQRLNELRRLRQPYESVWQDVAEYMMPERATFLGDGVTVDARRTKIYDSTVIQANELFAAFLHSLLTNPARPWFEMVAEDHSDDSIAIVQDANQRIQRVMAHARTGLMTALHELYLELGAFGTSAIHVMDQVGEGITVKSVPLSQLYIAESVDGAVNAVFRRYPLTAQQIVEQWGDAASASIQSLAKSSPLQSQMIVHAVVPRTDDACGHSAHALTSVYYEEKTKQVLSTGGFYEMPYMVVRLSKAPAEVYGRGPAMIALADIKLLNTLMKTNLRGVQKMVDPPILVPQDGFISRGGLGPGDIAYYDATIDSPDKIRPLTTGARPDVGLDMLADVRSRICSAFYLDSLLVGVNPNMSATEVNVRVEEKYRLLAPIFGRIQAELLEPLIQRVVRILVRAGYVDERVIDMNGRIHYLSPLARVQRQEGAMASLQVVQQLLPLMQLQPQLIAQLNVAESLRQIAIDAGVPQGWMPTLSPSIEVSE